MVTKMNQNVFAAEPPAPRRELKALPGRAPQAGQPTDRPMIGMLVVIIVVFMIIAIGGRTATPAILWNGGFVHPR